MSIQIKDANGATKYMQTNGAGTVGDPYRVVHDVNSSALPTGAATSANQTTELSKLDSIITNTGATENHLGEVSTNKHALLSITPTLDTAAYSGGDVFFATVSMGNAARVNDGAFKIVKVCAIDKGDQAAADLELHFFRTNVTFGTINNAPSISDSDAAQYAGYIKIATADWIDLGGVKVAFKECNIACVPTSGARTLYVAGVTGGTGTYAASDLVLNFMVEQK